MEYAAGGNLRDYLRRQPSQPSLAVMTAALEQLADAVSYVHAQGVVHRDLAARNCLLRGDGLEAVVLADFGCKHSCLVCERYVDERCVACSGPIPRRPVGIL
jgi:serine/threonine protein kinase